MSLFAAYHSGATRRPHRASTNSSPAISAAAPAIGRSSRRRLRPATARPPTGSPPRPTSGAAALAALADGADLFVGDETRFFAAPASLNLARRALRPLSRRDAGRRRDRRRPVDHQAVARARAQIIWLGRVAGPRRDRRGGDGALSLGAGVDAAATPRRFFSGSIPTSASSCAASARVQVRASGTVGGNIANGSPIGDLAPALIALGGRVVLRKGDATRVCRWRTSSSPTASRIARRANSSSRSSRAAPRRRPALSRLQGLEAVRRGHFRRDVGAPHRSRRAADRGRARRLRRHGGDAETGGRAPRAR